MLNGTIMVTNKNFYTDIDNKELTINQLKEKLLTECLEAREEQQPEKLALKLLNVIQVCIVMLWRINVLYHVKLDKVFRNHYHHLKEKGWGAAAHIHFMIEGNLIKWKS